MSSRFEFDDTLTAELDRLRGVLDLKERNSVILHSIALMKVMIELGAPNDDLVVENPKTGIRTIVVI